MIMISASISINYRHNFKKLMQKALIITMLANTSLNAVESFTPNNKIFIEAEQIYNDKKAERTIAIGNVIIVNNNRIMRADKAIYNQQDEKIYAEGNIAIMHKNEEYFADEANYNLKTKQGEALNFKSRIKNQDKLVAHYAKDIDENKRELKNVEFTKCNICESNLISNVPFWKVSAKQVVIDTNDETVTYKNAFINFQNIPFFYTPYFRTSFPGAKRKSGLLPPKFNRSKKFGFYAKVPIYLNLAPHMDLTIKPVFIEKTYDLLEAKFRYLTPWGQYNIEGSITKVTNPEDNERTAKTRGHIFTDGYFKYNDHDFGFDIQHVFDTDKTYLKNYDFSEKDILTSRLFLTHFNNKSFYTVEQIAFQDLRPSAPDKSFTGHAAPRINYYTSYEFGNDVMLYADNSFLNIHRKKGVNQTRITSRVGLSKYFFAPKNQVFKIDASTRGSLYQTRFDKATPFELPSNFDNVEEGSRTVIDPRLRISWQMPWSANIYNNATKIIEPIVVINLKPTKKIKDTISNEDTQLAEISPTTIFSKNKLYGQDRIEYGSSIDYGVNSYVDLFNYDLTINYTIGQTYHFKKEDKFNSNIDSKKGFSDYVIYIAANYNDMIDIAHSMRIDKKNRDIHLSDTEVEFKYKKLKLGVDYLRFSHMNMNEIFNDRQVFRKQLGINASYDLTKNWMFGYETRTNLGKKITNQNKKRIFDKYSLVYTNECIKINFFMKKDYTNFKNLKPDTTYQFNIELPI